MGPSTLASWALLIARALRERGIDADALFHRAGMPPVQLRDANSRYPAQSMQRLWNLAAAAAGDNCARRCPMWCATARS
ncbi:MAG TPA: AraC family transcriptional regulator ligand-binding domain-containing protein [Burkholderiales bacterium]|nr:AraC family transcriptional regulator ligand-binding domain-containing protein [Burkholderiales bacterium]